MVGVGVALLVVGVGDDDLGPFPADDGHQPAHGLVERGPGEAVGPGVGRGVGHARVPVAEHDDLVVADDRCGRRQFAHADGGEVGPDLGSVEGRIQDVALLAPGAADENGPDTFGVVPGDRAGTLRRLVVGVGVDGEEAQRRGHDHTVPGDRRTAIPSVRRPAPIACPAGRRGRSERGGAGRSRRGGAERGLPYARTWHRGTGRWPAARKGTARHGRDAALVEHLPGQGEQGPGPGRGPPRHRSTSPTRSRSRTSRRSGAAWPRWAPPASGSRCRPPSSSSRRPSCRTRPGRPSARTARTWPARRSRAGPPSAPS